VDLKARIQRHYDVAAPLYRELWVSTSTRVIGRAGQRPKRSRRSNSSRCLQRPPKPLRTRAVLDVGCGLGGSAKYLAEHFGSHVTGITVSLKQTQTAVEFTAQVCPRPQCGDGCRAARPGRPFRHRVVHRNDFASLSKRRFLPNRISFAAAERPHSHHRLV
jgi:SAM-dependent methyltransferase